MKTSDDPGLRQHLDQHQNDIDGMAKVQRAPAAMAEMIGTIGQHVIKLWSEQS